MSVEVTTAESVTWDDVQAAYEIFSSAMGIARAAKAEFEATQKAYLEQQVVTD